MCRIGRCGICESIMREENLEYAYNNDSEMEISICEDCIVNNEFVFYCEWHERIEFDSECSTHLVEHGYGMICREAYLNGDFAHCEECESLLHIDEIMVDEYDNYYCEECYNEHSLIPEYHSHEYDDFLEDDFEETNQFYGIELEIEVHETPSKVAEKIKPIIDGQFYLEHDSSLYNGFEIVSKPFSFNYLMNRMESTIEDMCTKLDTHINTEKQTAGMHIHITKQSYNHMFNMVCVFEYFKKEFMILSGREMRMLKRWSKFLIEEYDMAINTRMIEHEMDETYRYTSVNICNRKTIEVRIFNTTNSPFEIMARVEMIHNISEWCKANVIDEEFKDMPSFYEICTYKSDKYTTKLLGYYGLLKPVAI